MRRSLSALLLLVGLAACQAHGFSAIPTYPVQDGLIQLTINAPAGLYPKVEYLLETPGQADVPLAQAEPGADGQYLATYDTRTLADGRHAIAVYGLGADGSRTLLLRRAIQLRNRATASPSPAP